MHRRSFILAPAALSACAEPVIVADAREYRKMADEIDALASAAPPLIQRIVELAVSKPWKPFTLEPGRAGTVMVPTQPMRDVHAFLRQVSACGGGLWT